MTSAKQLSPYVTFVSDEDVVQHIVPLNDKITATNSKWKTVTSKSNRQNADISDDSDTDGDIDTLCKQPKELDAGDENFSGKDVFTFQTPKKSGRMTFKATEAATPKSEPSTPSARTPSSRQTKPSSKLGPVNKLLGKCEGNRKPQVTTPYRLHKRNVIADESSDESLDSSEEEAEDENRENNATQPSSATPRRRRQSDADVASMAEQYFDIHGCRTNVTSDRTLAKLGGAKMSHETLCNKLSSLDMSHVNECSTLMMEHQECFNSWMLHMCNGFNVLLYGLGSKHTLIEEFRQKMLTDFTHVVVNGYFPSLTIKQILNSITDDIIGHSGSFRTPAEQVNFIKEHLNEGIEYRDLYLVIHNIDGVMLRSEKTQATLSHLSLVRGIHIIASIDHINSSLIWDKSKSARFNWLWHDATTYLPYLNETSYENSLLVQQTGCLALSSLTHVTRSLTPNARGIFLLLAKFQLDNKDNANYSGMSFQDLYQRCRESFLVNSDLTLRTQLTEFRDHKLIRSKKGYDGTEYLLIPIEEATLVEFLESQEES